MPVAGLKIVSHCVPSLPTAAWLACLHHGMHEVVVRHGRSVEIFDDGFIEGGWSGPFEERGFLDAEFVCGSGARLRGGEIVFSTSSHTLEPLYVVRADKALFVSNSLPFALVTSGARLLDRYFYYDRDVMSIMFGLKAHRRTIPLMSPRGGLSLHYCSTLAIDRFLTLRTRLHLARPHFRSFAEYDSYLRRITGALQANLANTVRKCRYTSLATLPSGYDSSAAAVLAKAAGCTEAITFRKARDGFTDTDDSGIEVGRALGLRVTELDPDLYRTMDGFPEAEFLATGAGGEDVVFAGAGNVLSGRMLFTGYHGDRIWSLQSAYVNDTIKRGDPSGASLLEFRLRLGFVNLPVPFIGCLAHADINRISNDAEMLPWRIGGSYDRPIPRRIAETAGVPRQAFGQAKKAVSRPFQTTGKKNIDYRTIMSPGSLPDFEGFVSAYRPLPTNAEAVRFALLSRGFSSHKPGRLFSMSAATDHWFRMQRWRYLKPIDESALGFQWGLAKLKSRYPG